MEGIDSIGSASLANSLSMDSYSTGHETSPIIDPSLDFSSVLAGMQQGASASVPPINRWLSLSFLSALNTSRSNAANSIFGDNDLFTSALMAALQSLQGNKAEAASSVAGSSLSRPMSLADFPHPPGDNGWGIHWIPTTSQTKETVDKYVEDVKKLGMKWVVFLNDGADKTANDYLVKKLTQAGIEPVMRVYTPGLSPVSGDLKGMVSHYKKLGVNYYQLFNEPNLKVETGEQGPNVDRYLDLWVPAARQVVEAGGLPGFGALSPQGEMDDRLFLKDALQKLKNRGQTQLLDHAWLATHNYTGSRPINDPDGFLRFQQYDNIVRSSLGRSLPIIGTEGGTHLSEHVDENQQIDMVTSAYRYMGHREPYNFTYTYWILANGHDPSFEYQALYHNDKPTALAQAIENLAAGGAS